MNAQPGTIVELNLIDAVGWIELDDGGRVRFGGSGLKGFATNPGVGTRVEVHGTKPGPRGVPKAEMVRPLSLPAELPADLTTAELATSTPWPSFVREHPRWSDAAETCVPCRYTAPRPEVGEHPLFAPWHREILETAPTAVSLAVPRYDAPDAIEPGAGDCFAHGRIAFLDQPAWPNCGLCSRPLEMCIQLSPTVLADFLPGGRGLVALFCFHCGVAASDDPRVGHVRLIDPRHRVLGPPEWQSASSGWLATTQRVTPRAPVARVPTSSWYRYRSQRSPQTASSALLGFDAPSLAGPFPARFDREYLDDLAADYDEWFAARPHGDRRTGACLGGVANWDQHDATPSCPHGEMRHLLAYNGGQFLDGALHVFACRELACALAFVAEF